MTTQDQRRRAISRRRSKSHKATLEALEPRFCLTSYTTLDLMPLTGHVSSSARALNDFGLAVGESDDGKVRSAVVWKVTKPGNVAVSALPGLEGDNYSSAGDVNNRGLIVGGSFASGGPSHAVVWTGSFGSYVPHQLAGDGSGARAISEPDPNGDVWVLGDPDPDPALWKVTVTGAGDVT
jgi:uncharacterized membrane protein